MGDNTLLKAVKGQSSSLPADTPEQPLNCGGAMPLLGQAAAISADEWNGVTFRAGELMDSHKFGCSESVVLSFQEALGREILPPQAVAIASAFRGGLGGAGCLCGALAGGQIVLGSLFGYHGDADGQQDAEAVKLGRQLSKELHDRFRDQHKAVCCRVLTKGLTRGSPEAKAQCAALVRTTARLAGDIIAREATANAPKDQCAAAD
ncbi:C-GCAxxG-C-C family protein [Deltaproteobacteria bacterium OttesenSCG-928-K17]|nr:C-GCAxxG-C-C family protein [Deltaproteobacteria bacterium OttesenSCG-928-K17]